MWGHIGVRLPGGEGIMVKSIRPASGEDERKDWLVRFDFSGKKISGVGSPPFEAPIYTQIFKARPDVQAIAHAHAPMCIVLSLADKTVVAVHMQSIPFEQGVPSYQGRRRGCGTGSCLGSEQGRAHQSPWHRHCGQKHRRGLHDRAVAGTSSEDPGPSAHHWVCRANGGVRRRDGKKQRHLAQSTRCGACAPGG